MHSSTTVVDRRLAGASRAFGSGSEELGIDAFFASETSAADVQCRAILARVDAPAGDAVRER